MKTVMVPLICCLLVADSVVLGGYSGPPADIRISSRPETNEYSFAYSGGASSAHETREAGVTRGSFSYVDANGQVQSRSYISDREHGFVVTASDVPQDAVRDTPAVALARAQHLAAVERARNLVGVGGPNPVVDTPEVIAARNRHLAAVQEVRSRGWSSNAALPVPVQDTVEVAAAKAKHLSAVEEAKARVAGARQLQQSAPIYINPAVPVQDTPEVAVAKAKHFAAVAEAQARVAGAAGAGRGSIVSQYTPPASFHYPNVPQELPRWNVNGAVTARYHSTPAPPTQYSPTPPPVAHYSSTPAYHSTPSPVAHYSSTPAYQSTPSPGTHYSSTPAPQIAQRYSPSPNTYSGPTQAPYQIVRWEGQYNALSNEEGQYDPRLNDEGQYNPNQNDEGQYNPRLNDEGQYIPGQNDEGQYARNQNDEGQYISSQNDEGQYISSQNDEGQYIPSQNDEGQYNPSQNDEGQYAPSQYAHTIKYKVVANPIYGQSTSVQNGYYTQSQSNNAPWSRPVAYEVPSKPHFGYEYDYQYSNALSSKSEARTRDGVTRGRYSYVDANGILQTVEYEADDVHGFRATGTNLPRAPEANPSGRVGPVAAAYATHVAAPSVGLLAPEAPLDTPEVSAAKAAHFAAHREAGALLARTYSG